MGLAVALIAPLHFVKVLPGLSGCITFRSVGADRTVIGE